MDDVEREMHDAIAFHLDGLHWAGEPIPVLRTRAARAFLYSQRPYDRPSTAQPLQIQSTSRLKGGWPRSCASANPWTFSIRKGQRQLAGGEEKSRKYFYATMFVAF
jgi:hypothetical protein